MDLNLKYGLSRQTEISMEKLETLKNTSCQVAQNQIILLHKRPLWLTGYVTCLAASGITSGVALGPAAPAALVAAAAACSTVQGTCMAACTPLLLAPTP